MASLPHTSYYSPLSLMFPSSISSMTSASLTPSPSSMTPLPDSTVQMPEDDANTEAEASSQLSFKPSSSNRSVSTYTGSRSYFISFFYLDPVYLKDSGKSVQCLYILKTPVAVLDVSVPEESVLRVLYGVGHDIVHLLLATDTAHPRDTGN